MEQNVNDFRQLSTGSGDCGETGLADGRRVSKTSPVIALLGELDELNAVCGMLREAVAEASVRNRLRRMQLLLMKLSAACAGSPEGWSAAEGVAAVEQELSALFEAGARLPDSFPVPGDRPGSGLYHLARTVCRRAERAAWPVQDLIPSDCPQFLNRLSDWLFLLDCPLEPVQPDLFL